MIQIDRIHSRNAMGVRPICLDPTECIALVFARGHDVFRNWR